MLAAADSLILGALETAHLKSRRAPEGLWWWLLPVAAAAAAATFTIASLLDILIGLAPRNPTPLISRK